MISPIQEEFYFVQEDDAALTPKEKFKKYHADNPHIYEFFKKYAFKCIQLGYKHNSAEAIFNIIRWETAIAAKDGNFKINNNYKSFYSRMFMKEFPEHSEFFFKRHSLADEY